MSALKRKPSIEEQQTFDRIFRRGSKTVQSAVIDKVHATLAKQNSVSRFHVYQNVSVFVTLKQFHLQNIWPVSFVWASLSPLTSTSEQAKQVYLGFIMLAGVAFLDKSTTGEPRGARSWLTFTNEALNLPENSSSWVSSAARCSICSQLKIQNHRYHPIPQPNSASARRVMEVIFIVSVVSRRLR